MNFKILSKQVHQLNSQIGGQWESQWQLLWIVEEVGELSRELQKLQNLPAKLHADSPSDIQNKLTEELGDVLYGLVSLAKSLDIEPEDALAFSLRKFQKRHGMN